MGVSALSGGLHAWISDLDISTSLEQSPVETAAQEAGIPVVRPGEMRTAVEAGTHLILDARSMREYDQGHIPGAMSLPLRDFESVFPGIAPLIQPEDPLIVYCSGPLCDDAYLLAGRLREAGFINVSLYLAGWEGWSQ